MARLVVFGGTSEGRALCELLAARGEDALACVATGYGAALLPEGDGLRVRAGRLDRMEMEALLREERPRLVIDATHPYAVRAGANIAAACGALDIRRIRLAREAAETGDATRFERMEEIVAWLDRQPGVIFSALGAKEAAALTGVSGYRERVWLRILPDPAGLAACLELGFAAGRIVCMQGPFSAALNTAMLRAAGAGILLTKASGEAGGYRQKLEAARACGAAVAVLAPPPREEGLPLAALLKRLEEDAL